MGARIRAREKEGWWVGKRKGGQQELHTSPSNNNTTRHILFRAMDA